MISNINLTFWTPSSLAEHKPNVYFAQSPNPVIPQRKTESNSKMDSFEMLREINRITQTTSWDTFFHSSLITQFRFNQLLLFSKLDQKGKSIMAAHRKLRGTLVTICKAPKNNFSSLYCYLNASLIGTECVRTRVFKVLWRSQQDNLMTTHYPWLKWFLSEHNLNMYTHTHT